MFSKFKVEKPSHVFCRRGSRQRLTNILSLPLVEAYDQQICLMRAKTEQLNEKISIDQAIIQSQVTELLVARAEVFQLRQEVQRLRDELARSRVQEDPVKKKVKFNESSSFWELDKSSRSLKKKKIGEYLRDAADKLPTEFKPTEVRLPNF